MIDEDLYKDLDSEYDERKRTKLIITYNHSKYEVPYDELDKRIKNLFRKKGKTLSDKVRFTIKKQVSDEEPERLSKSDVQKHYYQILKYLLKSRNLEEFLVKKDVPKKKK